MEECLCICVLLQEPMEICVGESYYCTTMTGAKRKLVEKHESFQYVSFAGFTKCAVER